jgi:hypothetical protein
MVAIRDGSCQETIGPLLGEAARAGERDRHLSVSHGQPADMSAGQVPRPGWAKTVRNVAGTICWSTLGTVARALRMKVTRQRFQVVPTKT